MKTYKLPVKAITAFSTLLALFIFNPAKSSAADQDLITKGSAKFLMDKANAMVFDHMQIHIKIILFPILKGVNGSFQHFCHRYSFV